MASPAANAGQIEIREVVRDGELVAVLMAIDNGETFTVVSEVFPSSPEGPDVSRRPYAFANAEAGMAFFSEALTAFQYLGCHVRRP